MFSARLRKSKSKNNKNGRQPTARPVKSFLIAVGLRPRRLKSLHICRLKSLQYAGGCRPTLRPVKSLQIAAGLWPIKKIANSAGQRPVLKLAICWRPTVGEPW
jgi:hypothetical protein